VFIEAVRERIEAVRERIRWPKLGQNHAKQKK